MTDLRKIQWELPTQMTDKRSRTLDRHGHFELSASNGRFAQKQTPT